METKKKLPSIQGTAVTTTARTANLVSPTSTQNQDSDGASTLLGLQSNAF